MKKFLSCLLVLALSMAAFCCAVADEQEIITSGDWEYRVLADGTAEITNYSNLEATSIQIPETLDRRKVTNIIGFALLDCSRNSSFAVSPDHPTLAVIDGVLFSKPDKRLIAYPKAKAGDTYAIPQGIEMIGDLAFANCTSLTSISIPNSVTNIGGVAFQHCYSLTNISIPNSVTSIGIAAFQHCYSLTNISIPNSVTSIGGAAFYACSSLTSISIPNSVTSIGTEAFDECPNLTLTVGRNSYAEQYAKENNIPYTVQDTTENNASYALPDDSDDWKYRILADVQEIITSGDWSYRVLADGTAQITGYSILGATSIQIPDTLDSREVTDVSGRSFIRLNENSTFIVSSDHPTLAGIGGVLFSKPDKRLIAYPSSRESSTYAIPQGIETIGEFAFSDCTSLTNITIPNSVTSIGNSAFYDCSSLTSISIPESVTSIETWAFRGCSSLTSISIPNSVTSIRPGAFFNCSSLISIPIPNSVTSIGDNALARCSSLTSISIPDSVTSISDGAFNNCPNLTLTVGRDSYAEQFAKNHNISYTYKDANDWLTK